jgi:5'-methylthioadenosine phosphorylase
MQTQGEGPGPGDAIGVLGGSGLYTLDGMEDLREVPVTTPWGLPSAPPMVGRLAERPVIFIPRHGRGHHFLPSEINYRANVAALKQLGAVQVISVSAVGSMREEIRPGDFVLADQFIDRTHRRESTFFGAGCAGHVSFADPVCPELLAAVGESAATVGARTLHRAGTYLCIEGPQFSTRAESKVYRTFDVAVIGMTGATEAKLCREAELCFSLIALATDYDSWHPEEADVTAGAVVEVLQANIAAAKDLLRATLARLPTARRCGCSQAARQAIMTSKEGFSPQARARLGALYGRSFE